MGVLLQATGVAALCLPAMWYLGSRKPWKFQPSLSWRAAADDVRLIASVARPKTRQETRNLGSSLLLIGSCIIADQAVSFVCPLLFRRLLNQLTPGTQSAATKFPWAGITVYVLLKCQVTSAVQYLSWTVADRIENAVNQYITVAAYDKVLSLSAEYHDGKSSTAAWDAVRSSGEKVVQTASVVLFRVLPSVVGMGLALGTFANVVSYRVAATATAVMASYVAADVLVPTGGEEEHLEWMKAQQQKDLFAADAMMNWWTVFSFNRIGYERRRFAEASRAVRARYLEFHGLAEPCFHLKHAIQNFGLLVVCLVASYEVWRSPAGGLGGADIALVLDSWGQITGPLNLIVAMGNMMRAFRFDTQSLLEIFKREPAVRDREGAPDLLIRSGAIKVRDVAFAYNGQEKPAIADLSFVARGGQTIALVGKTGGGKSTVIKLLMRAYDTTSGSISIDGQDIRDVRKESLGEHISIVPQSVGVFNASVIDNIRYGRVDATLEECQEACRAVGLHEKISAFEKGYDECIGERGVKLSGGELQRLAIARVLVRDTKIVLFDEAMSNLDSETEYKVQQYLRKWCAGRTVVVVAHRLGTITHADQILAIREGRVVEQGTHRELLEGKGYYHELWEKQKLTESGSMG